MEQAAGHLYLFVDGSYAEPASGGGWFATDLRRMAFASTRLPNGLPNSETCEAYALHSAFGGALDAFPAVRSLTLMMDNLAVVDALSGLREAPARYAHKIQSVIDMARERGVSCEVAHVKSHQNKNEMRFIGNAVVDRLACFGRVGYVLSHAEPFHSRSWARRLREIDPELTILAQTIGHVRASEILRYPLDEIEEATRRHRVRRVDDSLLLTHSVLRLATQMRMAGHWGADYDRHLEFRDAKCADERWARQERERRERLARRYGSFVPQRSTSPTP